MKKIPFAKVVGSGNDFILLDRRRQALPKPAAWARRWCDRKAGIGADGILLVTPSKKADARMRIFNPDGSEAEMCGNGLRCVAWYLFSQRSGAKRLSLETGAGVLQAQRVASERIRLFLPTPKQLRLGLSFLYEGTRHQLHAVNTGVPHAVLFSSRLNRMNLEQLGPAVRYHKLFKPAGTNLDLVQIASPHRLNIRTYERGVEAETEACGTGAVASVVIGAALGRLRSPVEVVPKSQEKLTVGFTQDHAQWNNLHLEGPAKILFEGAIS